MSVIVEEMWELLNQVSDETGEQRLKGGYVLKYEGWSSICIPTRYKNEEAMRNYGTRQSDKILTEWRRVMIRRGYGVVEEGHDERLGLYGVTYALYRRV